MHVPSRVSICFEDFFGLLKDPLVDISYIIAAEPRGDLIQANSKHIFVVWQGWINDPAVIIGKIPYFGLDHTKFVFNILIKIIVDNLRAIRCDTTNHNCCSTICYWSMMRSASFEISMKWPVIVFIFCNDWRIWGSMATSNEKRSLIRGCNRVLYLTVSKSRRINRTSWNQK